MDMGHHMFDNVFVNPEAYRVFVATGTWPDKTVFMLEARRAEGKGLNQSERQLSRLGRNGAGSARQGFAVSRRVGVLWLR